jgi:hypothetical protein
MEINYITTSGGVISNQFIESVFKCASQNEYMKPESFSLNGEPLSEKQLDENIATAWEMLCPQWDKISGSIDNEDISKIRNRWITCIFDVLDFNMVFLKKSVVVNERDGFSFNFSHRGWNSMDAPIIHTVKASQEFDKRDDSPRAGRKSPHDLLQTYLNCSKDTFGIITNGKKIRLLHKYYSNYVKGYVEFDIAAIFESRSFNEFKCFYKLMHASRFVKNEKGKCPLDYIYEFCLSSGTSIGFGLQKNVKLAVETMGNGFMQGNIITRLQEDEEECKKFYNDILHVIYRILFLLFAEQRGMMPGRSSLYMDEYSITALRDKAEIDAFIDDENTDLWEGLKVTFKMVSEGVDELGIYPYDGMLFDYKSINIINELACKNKFLLKAIKYLTLYEKDGVLQRISYVDLGVEELGSIYEGLLDFSPRVTKEKETFEEEVFGKSEQIEVEKNTFFLDPRGSLRKQSGSYYTNPKLVDELVNSALMSVVENKLKELESKDAKKKALLSIKVCDASCGSGHFLIAANNYLAIQLACIEAENEYPSENDIRMARREVLIYCIYGVDLNPLAVELTKVSLWINACVKEYPLNFLDDHIKCGNSLIGASNKLISQGILTEAFEPLEGDDSSVASIVKKRNLTEIRDANSGQMLMSNFVNEVASVSSDYIDIDEIIEQKTPEQVHRIRESYSKIKSSQDYKHIKFIYDLWTASFYWPLNKDIQVFPTQSVLDSAKMGFEYVNSKIIATVNEISENYKFFHWELEFPEAFKRDENGFDCILGNPPWETIEFKEKEYFVFRAPNIYSAKNASDRKKLIQELKYKNPKLFNDYEIGIRNSMNSSHFIHNSNRYNKSAVGKINTYAIFTDLIAQLISLNGRAGIIVETGIATNDGTKDLFGYLVESKRLAKLIDFENREKLFPIHSSFRFCLLTITGEKNTQEEAELLCYATNMQHLQEKSRYFSMSKKDFNLVNPNTKTLPSCRNKKEKDILIKIYQNSTSINNAYKSLKLKTMFNMSTDSKLFRTLNQLKKQEYVLDSNYILRVNEEKYLPLYEAKLFHQYVFYYATFEGINEKDMKSGQKTNIVENRNNKLTLPRYWINQVYVDKFNKNICWKHKWYLGIRRIARATDERTTIASILPEYAGGHSISYLSGINIEECICIIALFNSFIFDFISRLKVGGINYDNWIIYQQPVITLSTIKKSGFFEKIKSNVLKLTYYNEIMKPFAEDSGYFGSPYKYDENERFKLKCELDAIYGKLYGITKEEFDYILETFPIVKQKDIEKYGNYKTKETILNYFDKL